MLGGGSITLFHVRGIRVSVDWSWFIVLFLVIVWLSDFYGDLLGDQTGDLGPYALAVTGDHATPAKMKSHSWHGVPFLLASPYTLPTADNFGERPCAGGSLGVFQAEEIMGYLMGHAMKLNRFGA